MKTYFTKTSLYLWILALTMAGFVALPLAGGGGLYERNTPLTAVEDEIDWTLANGKEIDEPDVDWTLANNKDKEEEVDWTIA